MATKKEDRDVADRPESGSGRGQQAAEAGRQGAEQTTENVVRAGSRMAEDNVAQTVEFGRRSSDQMRTLMSAGTQAYRGMTDYSKDDLDALMQSSARLAKGIQDMSWEVMQYTQENLRIGMRCANEMMGCRSVEDMLEISQNFVRQSVDTLLHESAKLLELSSTVATDAVNPINERVQSSTQH
jgi:hypothetical protein